MHKTSGNYATQKNQRCKHFSVKSIYFKLAVREKMFCTGFHKSEKDTRYEVWMKQTVQTEVNSCDMDIVVCFNPADTASHPCYMIKAS